jgi:glyoxylase-like metal-dependent hydrolase (beta-lactamase superfamily II)
MQTAIHEPQTADALTDITHDLAYMRTAIVNVFFWGPPGAGDGNWVLIDAGMYGFAGRIRRAAEERFGADARPAAIILTHGHFDHRGALSELAETWDVPVYAHELELPYLTGRSAYPPPDPTVGGGAMAALSWSYPRKPIDLGERVQTLPADGSVPGMPGWSWLHTPGHTAGHISLWRASDRTLIAGDAFVTTKQESLLSVLANRPGVFSPPAYFTPNWVAAHRSVERLARLEPEIAATGHGLPLRGPELRKGLADLALDWDAHTPDHGRYVDEPAVADASGVVSVPPAAISAERTVPLVLGAAVLGGIALSALKGRDN